MVTQCWLQQGYYQITVLIWTQVKQISVCSEEFSRVLLNITSFDFSFTSSIFSYYLLNVILESGVPDSLIHLERG